MNSALMFFPLAIWLLLGFAGTVCLAAAFLGLKSTRPALEHYQQQTGQPPLLSGATQGTPSSRSIRTFCLRSLLVLGLAAILVGALGVWSTRLSISYESRPVAEWADGRAPGLEPLIRRHCVPFVRQGKSIGLAVALVTPTNATIMTFGRPALSSPKGTSADTLFELGSITKTFTAITLARQIEHGAVRLDEPVQDLLPPGTRLPEEAREITLRQLTTHSSGFPRMPDRTSPLSGLGMIFCGTDPYAGYTETDLLKDVRTVRLQSKPGTHATYSNFGMTLLGYLLKTNAGTSYEALVKREVCLPLDMKSTTITISPGQEQREAQGYRAVLRWGPLVFALRSAPWFRGNDLGGAGALRSSANDMLTYLQANMHPEGEPLEHAIRISHEVLFREDDHTSFGMNWVHIQNQKLKQELIWHNGGTGGFRTFIGFTANGQFGVLALSNCSEGVDDLAVDLLREVIKQSAPTRRPPRRANSRAVASLAGDRQG
jgi:CubicO group peptidase (beta-lactamase class C family)